MTEEIFKFHGSRSRAENSCAPELPRSPGWHLNNDDLSVIDDLHATLVQWLKFAKDARSARIVADAMEALEQIAKGGSVSGIIELGLSEKSDGRDGLSISFQFEDNSIVLAFVEWIWMSNGQGHDHQYNQQPRLTPAGAFASQELDVWFYMSSCVTESETTQLSASQY